MEQSDGSQPVASLVAQCRRSLAKRTGQPGMAVFDGLRDCQGKDRSFRPRQLAQHRLSRECMTEGEPSDVSVRRLTDELRLTGGS
jgi:hypothetical protein